LLCDFNTKSDLCQNISVVSKWIYALFVAAVPQLLLYKGFAAQKHVFAALPQNQDRKNAFDIFLF
jgi:hypothetical protein